MFPTKAFPIKAFFLPFLLLQLSVPQPSYGADILKVDYESGTSDSGIKGLKATHAKAADAAFISRDYSRSGDYSIGHKVVLGDSTYQSNNSYRSESDTIEIISTRYEPGMEIKYQFSVLLNNWEDWSGKDIPIDIIWQFKHTQGEPDAVIGVKRNSLVLRYGESGEQATLIDDIRSLDNKWIDIRADILWSDTNNGYLTVYVRTEDETDFIEKLNLDNFKTFTDNGKGDFGYLKWGLYRPDSTSSNNALERVVYHDDITISAIR
ncbi:MAG: hypothetical protein F6K14_25275 [Symploca sp. SIO2C1]|nr:hypothetical protein [Symploca sp. SIO2C1]